MSLSVGIVGLPNAGKSTLFNALVGRRLAAVDAYPFTTIEPNTGVIEIPDPRLDKLADLIKPVEVRPATVAFVDIAGLVAGAHRGEGLGNQFLAHIRETDALIHVVDAFSKEANVKDDLETVHLELVLKDYETVARREEKLTKTAKSEKMKKSYSQALLAAAVGKLSLGLGEGRLARRVALSEEEREVVAELNLLTMKPEVVVVNVLEEALIEDQSLEVGGVPEDTEIVVLSAKFEMDLLDLSPAEQREYREEIGLLTSGTDELIRAAYRLLGLITFYTIKGGKIVQAWSIRKGATLLEAAALIHNDLAKGFIIAETIPIDKLLEYASWREAKQAGEIKTRGKQDGVEEGWVVEIKT
jgi:hypothetical protein